MQSPKNEQIQAVIVSHETIEALNELTALINREHIPCEISPLNMFCQKTGQIIGRRDENSLFSVISIYGKESAIFSLYNSVLLSTAPHWLITDNIALDMLTERDPINYACYCFWLITAPFYRTQSDKNPKKRPAIERYWAMARANELMRQRGNHNLTELNIELCKLLTYAPSTMNFMFSKIREFGKEPDLLANLHATGDLLPVIKDCVNKALMMLGRATPAIDGSDIVNQKKRLQARTTPLNRATTPLWQQREAFVEFYKETFKTPADMARGPSQIRKQKISRQSVERATKDKKENTMFRTLEKLFDDAAVFKPQTTSELERRNNAKMRERILKRKAEKEFQLEQDLSKLLNLNFDDFQAPDEPDENSVEIRTLARELSPDTQEQPAQPIIPTPTIPQKLSLAERIAANKAKKGS